MTEAFLPKRDVNVVQAGRIGDEAGNSGGEEAGGRPRIETLNQRWKRGNLESGV